MKDKSINEFYYKILNIRSNIIDIEEKIQKCIHEVVPIIKKSNENLDRVCKVIANNISISLKENKIDNIIINLKHYGLYEHEFVLSRNLSNNQINYFLIDPSFIQFKNEYPYLNLKKLNSNLLNNVINKGYSIVDDKVINDYFRSFNYEERIDLNELFMDIKTKKIK